VQMYPLGNSRRTIRLDLVRSMRSPVLEMGVASAAELDELDAAALGAFRRDLARSLNNLAYRLADQGRFLPEPGMWAQYDFGDGPKIGSAATVLFCFWLAWSRFRVRDPARARPHTVRPCDGSSPPARQHPAATPSGRKPQEFS
jgi:hypothetical protein